MAFPSFWFGEILVKTGVWLPVHAGSLQAADPAGDQRMYEYTV
jgi:hypothetical protein